MLSANQASFSHFFLDQNHLSLDPNTFPSLKSPHSLLFRPRSSLNPFGVFENSCSFWDFCKIFGLGWVVSILYAHASHIPCIITMFHAFKCVLDYYWCMLVGFDWVLPMMQFNFYTSHVHAYFMHTYSFRSPCYSVVICVLSLSLSLCQIDYAWHPSANLLQLRTLLVLGLLPLILPFPFLTFGSVMERPKERMLALPMMMRW